MKSLTERQAAVYEYLRTGIYTIRQIADSTNLSFKTVTSIVYWLMSMKYIDRHSEKKGTYAYTAAAEIEYVIGRFYKRPEEVQPDFTDIGYPFTENQVTALINFKQKKFVQDGKVIKDRTPLSKITGIPKFYLNLALERLG